MTEFKKLIWNNKNITLLKRIRAFSYFIFFALKIKRLCSVNSKSNIFFVAVNVRKNLLMQNFFVFILAQMKNSITVPRNTTVASKLTFLFSEFLMLIFANFAKILPNY